MLCLVLGTSALPDAPVSDCEDSEWPPCMSNECTVPPTIGGMAE